MSPGRKTPSRAEPARLAPSASPSARRTGAPRSSPPRRRRGRPCRRRSRACRAARDGRAARSTRRTRPCRRGGSRAARRRGYRSRPHARNHHRLLPPASRPACAGISPTSTPSPPSPRIERDLDAAEAAAKRFAERYRGRVAALGAQELAAALDELEALLEPPRPRRRLRRAASSPPTPPRPRTARCSSACRSAAAPMPQRARLLRARVGGARTTRAPRRCSPIPPSPARRHLLESMRRYRPHVLSRARGAHPRGAREHRRARLRAACSTRSSPSARFRVTSATARRRSSPRRRRSRCSTTPTASAGAPRRRALTEGLQRALAPPRLRLQHAGAGQGDRGPAARLRRPDGRAPPRQRDRRRRASTALLGACERALPARAALLPAEGAPARARHAARLRPLRADRARRAASVGFDERARDRARRVPRLLARAGRRSPGASSSGAGSTPSCGPASAAAPSPPRRCRARIPTSCSTTPASCAT